MFVVQWNFINEIQIWILRCSTFATHTQECTLIAIKMLGDVSHLDFRITDVHPLRFLYFEYMAAAIASNEDLPLGPVLLRFSSIAGSISQ